MKKYILIIIFIILLALCIYFYASKGQSKEDAKIEPTIIHKTTKLFTFEEAIEEADLIVKVSIGKKIDEINEDSYHATSYEAEILDSYKNDLGEKQISINQKGNSNYSYGGAHMFEKGEEYILFLRKANRQYYDTNSYIIVSGESWTFQVKISKNKRYLIKQQDLYESELMQIKLFDDNSKKIKDEINRNKLDYEEEKDLAIFLDV